MDETNESSSASREPAGWYILVGDRELGPLAPDRLAALAANGCLRRGDLLWHPGSDSWVAAEKIAGLFPPALPHGGLAPAVARSPAGGPGADATDAAAVSRHAARRRGNYFMRHWRGELSLPVSYWINGAIGNVVIAFVGLVAGQTALIGLPTDRAVALPIVLLSCLIFVVTTVWLLVGLWRSSMRYRREHPTGYWHGVAQLALGVMVVWIAGQIFVFAADVSLTLHRAAPVQPDAATPLIPPGFNRFQR